jgi:cell wall assembly regulator SMI1
VSIRRLAIAWRPFGIENHCAKGASEAKLARLQKLGAIPRELFALLAWHDGSRDRGIDGYYRLLSCAEIARFKKQMDALVPDFEDAWMPGEWWNLEWIPFLEFEGDLICVDGNGRVTSYRAYRDARPVLAPSFRAWLAALVERWQQVPEGSDEFAQVAFLDKHAPKGTKRVARRRP